LTLPPEVFPEAISTKQVIFVLMTLGFLAVAIPAALRFEWMDRVCIAGIWFMAINPVDVTFFSYTAYRGDIRGIEFGVTDWLTITLAVAMLKAPRWQRRDLHFRNPNEVWMALYLAYCGLSIVTAMIPQFAFFGVTKLLRAYLTFWVSYNFIRRESDLRFVIWCVAGLSLYSFSQVLMDKYVHNVFPPRGSFPHQNGLATFQNIMNFILFAFLLQDSEKLFDRRTLLYWVALGAGVLTSIATLSRGGMVTLVFGCAAVAALTFCLRQRTVKVRKKLVAMGVIVLLSLPALVVVLPEVINRFQTAPEESGESRHAANLASESMGDDHFFGVGLNNYSYAINYQPYGEHLALLDRGIAHHIFWLHYAELGILGVVLYVALTGAFIWIALRFVLRRTDSLERVFAIAVFVAFVVNWLIGLLEWNFRIIQITLTYFMLAGFVCSLDRVERERTRGEAKRRLALGIALLSGVRRRVGARSVPAQRRPAGPR
jgi:hypothetical protein